jgi:hypothetical protein
VSYCRSCHRTVPDEEILCKSCQVASRNGPRVVALLGIIGVPILLTGIGSLNVRLCIIGAIVAGAAAVLHVVLTLR